MDSHRSEQTLLFPMQFHPLTTDRWADFERLFGERGAYGGCWCMFWRLPSSVWSRNTKAQNKQGMKAIVESGPPPGLLAYSGQEVVGWVSVGPRAAFPHIERSRTLKRLNAQPTWSVNCFLVAKPYRGHQLMLELLKAAIEYARRHGAMIVEGYPLEPRGKHVGTMEGYVGIASVFRKAGFRKVRRRIQGVAVSRYQIAG